MTYLYAAVRFVFRAAWVLVKAPFGLLALLVAAVVLVYLDKTWEQFSEDIRDILGEIKEVVLR